MTRLRRDRVSLGRRGRVVYWGHWTCRVGGTSPRCCVGVYSSGSLRRYSAARGQRTDTPRSGPEEDAGARLLYRRHRYFALAYRRVPLLGTLIRYSEAGSSPPHVNPLFRMWATPPTCGTGGPRAEQGAGVRAQHDAVATQASSRGSRNERLDFLIGDADQHVVKDPGEACGPREVFRRGRRTIGGVNDVAVSVLGVEGPDI